MNLYIQELQVSCVRYSWLIKLKWSEWNHKISKTFNTDSNKEIWCPRKSKNHWLFKIIWKEFLKHNSFNFVNWFVTCLFSRLLLCWANLLQKHHTKSSWNANFISQELTSDATEDCHIIEMKLLKPGIYHLFLCKLQTEIYNGDKSIWKLCIYL